MSAKFKVVDLFAGPGGLAEGFSSIRDEQGQRIFDIALSVEKDVSAYRTLRLRAFFRQFSSPPLAYYSYIAGKICLNELVATYPGEWQAAEAEAKLLELGTESAKQQLDPMLEELRCGSDPTILIGGPPCQAYSLAGRARNKGIIGYEAAKDHRHFLYKEYIRIIGKLRPDAFIMENVKGILSSKVDGEHIFDRVLCDLRASGGNADSYIILPLVLSSDKKRHSGHIIKSEEFGIPQRRHRVILLGIRKDVMAKIPSLKLASATLKPIEGQSTVASVLEGMSPLRSGLSKVIDTPENWRKIVSTAFQSASKACAASCPSQPELAKGLLNYAVKLSNADDLPGRSSDIVTAANSERLNDWLSDNQLLALPNHETRGHMEADLSRYAFAAMFSELYQRSPNAKEYPADLAPAHSNWESGKFSDRFRVQGWTNPSTTITSHISKDGHYFIHPDPMQCRSLTVREAARLQTFPDNYFFEGNRTQQFVQVGNAVPPLLARQIAELLAELLT